MNLKNKATIAKSKLIALLLVVVLATAVLASVFTYIVLSNSPDTNLTLDVEIQPRDVKLVVGQMQKFGVIVHNGSSPYMAEWYSNGSSIASGLSIDFRFLKPCAYTNLSVWVTDARGNVGFDWTRVYDPTYLTGGSFTDDYSYQISYKNSTHIQMKNGTTGTVNAEGTNATTIHNWAFSNLTNGGTVLTKAGTYECDNITILYDYTGWLAEKGAIIQARSGQSSFVISLLDGNGDGDLSQVTIQGFTFDIYNRPIEKVMTWEGSGDENKLSYFRFLDNHFINGRDDSGSQIYICNYDYIYFLRDRFQGVKLIFTNDGHPSSNSYVEESLFGKKQDVEPHYFIEVRSDATPGGSSSAPHTRGNHFFGQYNATYGFDDVAIFCNATSGNVNLYNHEADRTENSQYLRTTTSGSYVVQYGKVFGGVFADRLCNNSVFIDLDQNTQGIEVYGNNFLRVHTANISMTYIKDRNDASGNGLENHVHGNTLDISNAEASFTTAMDLANATTIVNDNINYNPVGYIANPVNGTRLIDSGGGSIANNTQYTVSQSPKTIYISGGTIINVYINSQAVFTTTNVTVYLIAGDTFEVEWSAPSTNTVMGH